jgi:hypothetical protein
MAKKRRKLKRRGARKSKGLDKRIVTIAAFFAIIFFIVLLSVLDQSSGKIIVTNMKLEEGEPSYVNFDIKHTFPMSKECYAEVKLYQYQRLISSKIESLGILEPNKVVSKSLSINFPSRGIDFKIDIDCK